MTANHANSDEVKHHSGQQGEEQPALERPMAMLSRVRALDPVASALAGITERRNGRIVRLARGEPLGHPAHPALTDLPIGFWTSAFVLDLVGGRKASPASRLLVGAGVLSALPTIATGLADLPSLPDSKRRVAAVHAAANLAATTGYAWSWRLRKSGRPGAGVGLAMLSALTASAGGALGGWLAFGATSDPDALAGRVVDQLDGRRIATAESCTAGRIATAFAGVDGAADFFAGSVVAYKEQIKRQLLGVNADSIYSEEAALEMAQAACRLLDADVAVATTGVVGGEPQDGVPVGTVFIGTSVNGVARAARYEFEGTPAEVCDLARDRALRDLSDVLSGDLLIKDGDVARVSGGRVSAERVRG